MPRAWAWRCPRRRSATTDITSWPWPLMRWTKFARPSCTGAARLLDELQVAHGDGSFARRLAALAKLDLLVIDDFAISPVGPAEPNDLLELLDDRIDTRSTLITSQLPVKAWHTYLNDPTLADAILDRIVHSSHKIELKGTQSMRDADAAAAA